MSFVVIHVILLLMNRRLLALVLLPTVFLPGCIFAVAVSPSSADANIVIIGRWSGTTSDSAGNAAGVWALAQNGTALTGTTQINDSTRSMAGDGTIRGTVNGKSISFHMEVPTGGFAGAMATCSMVIDGEGTMSADGGKITGSYTGSLAGMIGPQRSCGGALGRGTFSMAR
jgi:hypothetical protein